MDELPLSSFSWNEVVFRSFRAGYLKRIDMDLFRRLESPVAKRLYRLLDKRFYHKPRWEFDLRELACEHVGLSRRYDAGQMKRKLRPAIAELEETGFLLSMSMEERFFRVSPGKWTVCFAKANLKRSRLAGGRRACSEHGRAGNPPNAMRNERRLSKKATGPKKGRQAQVEAYLKGLDEGERRRLQREALEAAEPLLASCYKRSLENDDGKLARVYRGIIVHAHVSQLVTKD
jgi:hypothetical protein